MKISNVKIFLVVTVILTACSLPPVLGHVVSSDKIRDGEYQGKYRDFPNSAKVRVKISDGRIVECEVVDFHGVLKKTGAEETIPRRIVENQSTDVDAVSGATNFSRVIMNAAQRAVDKAAVSGR